MQKLLALLGAKNKEEFVELFKQFIKFGLVGVSNTAVSMAVYYTFLWIIESRNQADQCTLTTSGSADDSNRLSFLRPEGDV